MSMSSDTCTTPTAAGMLAFGLGTAPDLPAGGLALSRARRMMSGRTARRLAALVTIALRLVGLVRDWIVLRALAMPSVLPDLLAARTPGGSR